MVPAGQVSRSIDAPTQRTVPRRNFGYNRSSRERVVRLHCWAFDKSGVRPQVPETSTRSCSAMGRRGTLLDERLQQPIDSQCSTIR